MSVTMESCFDKHVEALGAVAGLRFGLSDMRNALTGGLSNVMRIGTYGQTYLRVAAVAADIALVAVAGFAAGYLVGSALDCAFHFSSAAYLVPESANRRRRESFATSIRAGDWRAERVRSISLVAL
jgi:hypothetical protein